MIISPCNQGPANYHVTRWRWSAVPAPNALLLLLFFKPSKNEGREKIEKVIIIIIITIKRI